ncbi:hypothetical protein EW146_g10256, partial [Bondarzewia mesenterica]
MATLAAISLAPLPSPELSDVEDNGYMTVRPVDTAKFVAELCQSVQLDRGSARYERRLGDSELSYYLPSRASGVNDMYLHLGFKAPERLVSRARVRAVWAVLRMRHPLLASRTAMRSYEDVRFVFTPPNSPEVALQEADAQLQYRVQSKDELIDSYLNGPRTLSNDRLSYLIISRPSSSHDASLLTPPQTPVLAKATLSGAQGEQTYDYEWLMCAAHFIGDGMALHTFANDFFGLLGSTRSQEELERLVVEEWQQRWGKPVPDGIPALPVSPEERLPEEKSNFRNLLPGSPVVLLSLTLLSIDLFFLSQGGQSFPRRSNETRRTIVPTVPFDESLTRAMLKKCKSHGVSIASALFAICNVAWARMSPRERQELPMMMYAALNIRPYFVPRPLNDSYWFLAVGYFNVILPNFLPGACEVSRTSGRVRGRRRSRAGARRRIDGRVAQSGDGAEARTA